MAHKRIWLAGIAIVLIFLTLDLLHLEHAEYLEKKILDTYFRIRGSTQSSAPVVIVAVDDKSVFQYGPWPWPRQRMAELIGKLSGAKPRVIAFDIVFPPIMEKTKKESQGDVLLSRSAKEAGNVIFPVYFQLGQKQGAIADPIPPSVGASSYLLFDDIQRMKYRNITRGHALFSTDESIAARGNGVGHVNTVLDTDGAIRYEPLIVRYGDRYFPPLSVQAVRKFLDLSWGEVKVEAGKSIRIGPTEVPMDGTGLLLINYYGPSGSFPYLSYADVMNDPDLLHICQDKIVLVGVTAAGIHDQWKTPFDVRLPGVEKHGNIIANILENRFLSRPSYMGWVEIFSLVVFGTLFTGFFPRMKPRTSIVYACVIFVFILLCSYLAFAAIHLWFQPLFPLALVFFLESGLVMATQSTGPAGSPERPDSYEELDIIRVEEHAPTFSEDDSMTGIRRIGRYIMQEEIGRGAMGVVYKALDPNINRTVVIKTIRFDQLYESGQADALERRFFTEAEAAGQLSHPNIVTIYDAGKEAGHSYIAMEYIQGKELTFYCRKNNLMAIKEVGGVIADVCDALDYAHGRSIVHRDIKPANIMIQEDGRVRVMDFGIAKLPASDLTQTGMVIGTPSYMSPEQVHGEDLDRRSDIFSIGIVLYELLTGEKPFKGENVSAVIFRITEGGYPEPQEINGEIPDEYVNIIEKALKKGRKERYQTAGELAEDLRSALLSKE